MPYDGCGPYKARYCLKQSLDLIPGDRITFQYTVGGTVFPSNLDRTASLEVLDAANGAVDATCRTVFNTLVADGMDRYTETFQADLQLVATPLSQATICLVLDVPQCFTGWASFVFDDVTLHTCA